ncbi:hypothetical protein EJ065_7505 [Corallococcus coralloides]|uniref:Endonuclease/exonuclease/phosphatase domain-containing protein n=1 Tax=Corallococcus coralloides TaxID=184914 RepID=A0A410S4A0_CORCK|nr:hypothetical protein [Corallococcus coralloides]QAT89027.1 hypothetical protein EJ065_7505 [Corallococcus coralloides]
MYYCTICGFYGSFMLQPQRCRGCRAMGSMKKVTRVILKGRPNRRPGTYTLRSGEVIRRSGFKVSPRSNEARKELKRFKAPLPDNLRSRGKQRQPLSGKRPSRRSPPPIELAMVVDEKEEAALDLGVGTFNINHFSAKTEQDKKDLLLRLFLQNPWLDVLVLQEINKKALPLLLEIDFEKHGLALALGPQMQAVYPKYKGQKVTEEDSDDDEEEEDLEAEEKGTGDWSLGKSQCEWYPIIYRKSTCAHTAWRAFSDDTVVRRSSSKRAKEPIHWAKPVNRTKAPKGWGTQFPKLLAERKQQYEQLNERFISWRPVVVHDVRICGRDVHIGVVHTSPAGKGLGRLGEYEQVSGFFEHVSENNDLPWIIAGDYYIDPEASVGVNSDTKNRKWDDLFHERAAALELTLAVPLSATNQSPQTGRSVNSKKNKEQFEQQGYIKDWAQVGTSFKLNKRADFFVISKAFALHHTGIFSPIKGLLPVDPNHQALNFWSRTSDHAPTGGIFCTTPLSSKWAQNRQLISESLGSRQSQAQLQLWELHKQAVDALLSSTFQLAPLLKRLPEHAQRVTQRLCVLVFKALNSPAAIAIQGSPYPYDAEVYAGWKVNSQNVTDQNLTDFFGLCAQVDPSTVWLSNNPLDELAVVFRNAYRALQQLAVRAGSFDLTPEGETYSKVKLGVLSPSSSLKGKEKTTGELEEDIIGMLSEYLEQRRAQGSPPGVLSGCTQGSVNQFQVPGGRTACSAMAVLGIAALLSNPDGLDTRGIDNVLLEGTALYQRMNTATEDEALLMQALALSCGGVVDPLVLQPQAPYYNPLEIPEEDVMQRGLLMATSGSVHRDTLPQELLGILKQAPRMGVALVLGGYTVAVVRRDDALYLFDSHGWKTRSNAFVQRYAFVNQLLDDVGKMARSRALFDPEIGVTLYLPAENS